ncbi:activating signal cointegrator 1 complex subunit 2 isoform X1 [Trifolium pratense]|uniref:activating signal cointegrator 1 complex subunit 2 isoform X1 n=1 Tax=Trifolium pratense TaxID=57577 RepID=UPI001E695DA0|nr:activating signal cointegrator 1 complex subunit 2 isoform X1 [Trifolium pratense]
MSNRYGQAKQQDHTNNNNKGFNKTQKKFVPKNPTPTLSTSLRENQQTSSGTNSSSSGSVQPARGVNRNGNFVYYLPQDEAVASGFGAEDGGLDALESQKVVDLLNSQLSRLLKLKPKDFWSQVASDTSLHEFLNSFLQFRSRWYDLPHRGTRGIVAGVIFGEHDLSRRVFMVFYRMSSNRDPGAGPADTLSLRDHEVLLQERKLLDLPKLFDICAIYNHENEELTRLLVRKALHAQPWVHDNLTAVTSHFMVIVSTMHERCSSSLEVLFASGSLDDHSAAFLKTDLLEVMDFINDAFVSMDAFVSAYEPAALWFSSPVEMSYGNEELLSFLARLHDSLIPSMQKGFHIIFADKQDDLVSNIVVSLKMLRMRLVKFGWQLLHLCYLSDDVFLDSIPLPAATKMFPANVEDPVIRADILVQTFREINSVSLSFGEIYKKETFLQDVERNFNILSRIEGLKHNGWIFIDDEQLKYISGILSSPKEINKEPYSAEIPVPKQVTQTDEDAVVLESKISQIRDLFPDYGKGFLSACLEVYDQNPEEVIQRILEGTLHKDLMCLDTSLETVPKSLAKSNTVSRNDKGKGILIDSTPVSSNTKVFNGKQQTVGPLMPSSVPLGKFVRKSTADTPDASILDNMDEIVASRILQYEYDDEYDDSFDDLGLSVADSGVEENEMLDDEMNEKSGKSRATGTGNSVQNGSNTKWGSRQKPQYYVKDGKNYSYKVAGSVAVANSNEASLVNEAQKELIHGLGRGGNLPLGAVQKLAGSYKGGGNQFQVSETEGRGSSSGRGKREGGRHIEHNQHQEKQADVSEVEGRDQGPNNRGRGRGRGRHIEHNQHQETQSDDSEVDGRDQGPNNRGRGRGRGRGGGRNNHYRKDQAMKKHFSGLGGF